MSNIDDLLPVCHLDEIYKDQSIIVKLKSMLKIVKLCNYRVHNSETNNFHCIYFMNTQPYKPKEKYEQLKLFEVNDGIYSV